MQDTNPTVTIRPVTIFPGDRKALEKCWTIREWELREKQTEIEQLEWVNKQVRGAHESDAQAWSIELARVEKCREIWKAAAVTFMLLFLAMVVYTFGIR